MAKPPSNSIRSYADRIEAHWHRATASIMEVARVCAEANRKLSAAEKRDLLTLLPFAAPTFSKLAKVGEDQRLQSNRVQKLLPPSHSIIYAVAQLADEEFKAAIKDGIIKPEVKRAELAEWRRRRRSSTSPIKPPTVHLPDVFFAAIRLTSELTSDRVQALNQLLDRIRDEFAAEIIRPRDRDAEAMGRWYERVVEHMRKEARRIVAEMKKRALSKARNLKRKSLSTRERELVWGFKSDETSIEHDANEDRIREVLDIIGRGDEFEGLRDRALSEVEQPTLRTEPPTSEEIQQGLNAVAEQVRKEGIKSETRTRKLI